MGKVVTHASMSLDGFIADPNDRVGPLFDGMAMAMSSSRAAIRIEYFIPRRPALTTPGVPGRQSRPM